MTVERRERYEVDNRYWSRFIETDVVERERDNSLVYGNSHRNIEFHTHERASMMSHPYENLYIVVHRGHKMGLIYLYTGAAATAICLPRTKSTAAGCVALIYLL